MGVRNMKKFLLSILLVFVLAMAGVLAADPTVTTDCATTATVGTAYTCTATGSDADSDTVTLTVSGVTEMTISSGAISWTPTTSQIGTQTFTVTTTSSDSSDATGTASVSVTVSGTEIEKLLAAIDNFQEDVDAAQEDLDDIQN